MARYFFALHECGTILDDEEGRDLPDLAAARQQAVTAARAVMCAEIDEGRLCLSCRIVVTDADRRELLTVPFREAVLVSGM